MLVAQSRRNMHNGSGFHFNTEYSLLRRAQLPMSRWDYDTVLYRVFCITLLGVAFTFTVVLTNVFVDIDGLLAKKDKAQPPKPTAPINHDLSELSRVMNVKMAAEDKSEDVYEDKDYQDSNDLYRSKRSLETPDQFFHIKDPKVKKLLTNHLANLLDELDERDSKNNKGTNKNNFDSKHVTKIQNLNRNTEDSSSENKNNVKEPVVSINEYFKYNTDDFKTDSKKRNKEDTKEESIQLINDIGNKSSKTINSQKDYKSELLHLAMHNVILQGIIENTNLDDVYKKVADVVKKFEKDNAEPNLDELTNIFKDVKHDKKRVENSNRKTLLEELTSGKEPIRREYDNVNKNVNDQKEPVVENNTIQGTTTAKPSKDHNVVIKTLIDITAMSNDKSNKGNDQDTKDKINGIIKLIYNGNVIKFKRMEDENNTSTQSNTNKLDHNTTVLKNNDLSNQTYYKKTIYDYLKKFNADSSEQEKVISKKRLKRHIKIKYDNNKSPTKQKNKKDDDELFVEIETHFDSKGLKGEKKKKMIKELIGKIQNALHSDHNEHKKKQKHWHVKKRVQDPLSSQSAAALIKKLILPLETLAHRHLDPISKNIVLREELPVMTNMFGRKKWEKPYYSPGFFAKAINSAEANTVDTDYNKVMKHNGIPQRLQKPLNTEMSDDVFEDSKIVDLGNIKFLMKDIGGTGFSIGFNQYTDEAPDTETMKLFSGLENIIQTYHQQYDQESPIAPAQNIFNGKNNIADDTNNEEELVHKYDEHVVRRRSILTSDENDHHPNNYRILYGHNLPYKNYDDIFYPPKSKNSKIKNTKLYRKKNEKSSFVIDEHVFEKDLRPAEILSIANFLQRKKRSMKVKKISSVKLKSNINRYINTHNMASKSIFTNKKSTKRTKRQIDKIRIIARDLPQNVRSDEDNIFVVSDEKIFADRALVREVDVPEIESDDKARSVEHYDIITPQKEEEFFDIDSQSQKMNEEPEDNGDVLTPYIFDVSPFEVHNEFSRRARHNSLMSKYPHIIMDETPYVNHGEQFLVDNIQQAQLNIESTTMPPVPTIIDIPSPNEQEITELISPPKDHSNYRVSVKIRPKNSTNMSGFKEVHTSINKSYNKNGLTYTSLVNVSQLSKVEKLNKTVTRRENDEQTEQKGNLKQQHDLIKALIQQHKRRLDTQLKHLQSEKQKLENMYKENSENNSNKPPTRVKKLRKSLQEDAKKKRIRESTTEEVTTEPPTELTTEFIPEYIQTTTEDTLKYKMLETIERNENITNELLKKIDQNTGVLKIFLGKLIATIDVPSRRSTEITPKTEDTRKDVTDTNKGVLSVATTPTNRNTQNNQLPLNFEDYHYMPNVLFRHLPKQVNSSYGIPFVYAVQHPYGVVPNRDNMASVVYHGHIHTNTMNDNVKRDTNPIKVVLQDKIKVVTDKKNTDEFWKPKPGEKVIQDFFVSKNNTRFFLDDARNEFTTGPFIEAKKIFPPGIANSTKV